MIVSFPAQCFTVGTHPMENTEWYEITNSADSTLSKSHKRYCSIFTNVPNSKLKPKRQSPWHAAFFYMVIIKN